MKIIYVFCLSLLLWSCESSICPRFDADIVNLDTIASQQNKYFNNLRGDTICFSFLEQISTHKQKSNPRIATSDACKSGTHFLFLSDSVRNDIELEMSYYLVSDKHNFLLKLNGIGYIWEFQHIDELDTILEFKNHRSPIFLEEITLEKGKITKLTDTLHQEWYRVQ